MTQHIKTGSGLWVGVPETPPELLAVVDSVDEAGKPNFGEAARSCSRLRAEMGSTAVEHSILPGSEFRAAVVPGPLQTKDYMEALFKDYLPGVKEPKLALYIGRRLGASSIALASGARFKLVMGETALWNGPGGPAVQREQLDVLQDTMENNPRVQLLVAQPAAFTDPRDIDFVYLHGLGGDEPATFVHDPRPGVISFYQASQPEISELESIWDDVIQQTVPLTPAHLQAARDRLA